MAEVPEDRDLRLLFTDKPRGEQPVHVNCNRHRDDTPSLAVYRDHSYCYSCRTWTGYWDFLREMERDDAPVAESKADVETKTYTPEELRALAEQYHERLYTLGKEEYFFKSRFFAKTTVDQYLLGYAASAYTIPVWNNGVIQSIRFRRDDEIRKTGAKYYGLVGLNGVMLFAPTGVGPVVVWCEGELDCLLLTQLGYCAISLTNGIGAVPDSRPFVQMLVGCGRLILAVDCDEASYEPMLKLVSLVEEELPECRVRVARFFHKDITELFKHRGEQGVREVLRG